MRARFFLALATLCAVAAACENPAVESGCANITSTVASTRGDTVTTSTGLRYINVRAGTGTAAASCSTVGIHYTLYLNNVAVDSLRDPRYAFPVIPGERPQSSIMGVAEGVLGLQVGAVRRLIIPPSLGYGSADRKDSQGRVVVPANSTLIFDLEVVRIEQ
jgi:peptidylprolyl isomerase